LLKGLRISWRPSKSTTSRLVSPTVRISNLCSVLVDQI